MNREDIIRMAREAGFYSNPDVAKFEHFANLVAAAEREACARLVQDLCDHRVPASVYANTIRARGEKCPT
jgi:hypothetical protein